MLQEPNGTKKRTKLSQPCLNCYENKLKCDGCKPSCENCSLVNEACDYLNPFYNNNNSNKISHHEIIEGKIENLESKIDRLQQLVDNTSGNLIRKNSDRETSSIINFIPPNNSSDLISSLSSEVSEALLKAYFKYYHHMYPIVHPESFFYRLKRGEIPKYLLYSMYAAAAKYSCLVNLDAPYMSGEYFGDYAYEELNKQNEYNTDCLIAMANIAKLQYEMGYVDRGWIYGGMAIRIAYNIRASSIDNIDQDNINLNKSQIEKETVRRAWWVAYCTDIFAMYASGNHSAVQETSDVCNYPNENIRWNDNINGHIPNYIEISKVEPLFTLHIKLFEMIHKISKFRNNLLKDKDAKVHFNSINRSLGLWREELPLTYEIKESFGLNDNEIPQYLVLSLHSLYNALVIMLNSTKFAYTINPKCSLLCLNAAKNISNFVFECYSNSLNNVLPFYINYCLYMSSRIIINNNSDMSWEDLLEKHPQFSKNIMMIKSHKMVWGLSQSYIDLLRYYYRNFTNQKQRISADQASVSPSESVEESDIKLFMGFLPKNQQS